MIRWCNGKKYDGYEVPETHLSNMDIYRAVVFYKDRGAKNAIENYLVMVENEEDDD